MPGIQKTSRMELLRVRRRLRVARRGHKLLQDKRDKLIQEFLRTRHQERSLRRDALEMFRRTYQAYALAQALAPEGLLEATLPFPPSPARATLSWRKVMNVSVPRCGMEVEIPVLRYGPLGTTVDLDWAVAQGAGALEALADLVSLEGALIRLAREIEQTRRMVNNLEYIVIPDIEAEEERIVSRLDLRQMENLSRLQRIKEIIRASRAPMERR
jgi:V/A-type H+-transporting ATPase subunit D